MVNNSKAFTLAKYAIMFATIFVAMMIDRGISAALPISMAICVLLVTFSFCFIQNSWTDGIAAFTFFGIASFIKAFIFPDAIKWFYKPVVYVLPRILAGVMCFGVYKLMLLVVRRLKQRRVAQVMAMTVAIAVGLISNTVFFLLPYGYLSEGGEGFVNAIKGVVILNILPEYLTSLLVAPWVVLGVRRGLRLGIDGNNWRRVVAEEQTESDMSVFEQSTTEQSNEDGVQPNATANVTQTDVTKIKGDKA